ncbi:MAG: hypothetical protein LLG20_22705 [Acidobacteriales bacterium]|nr:hypothetical protein [Terriglobales bacterium]
MLGYFPAVIPFDEIDTRLDALGLDRKWLSEHSGKKPDTIRGALAPGAPEFKRSASLQKALSDTIEAEEARRKKIPPGYSEIFISDEDIDRADKASRIAGSPSLAAFCRDVIQEEARRILAGHQDPVPQHELQSVPDHEGKAEAAVS